MEVDVGRIGSCKSERARGAQRGMELERAPALGLGVDSASEKWTHTDLHSLGLALVPAYVSRTEVVVEAGVRRRVVRGRPLSDGERRLCIAAYWAFVAYVTRETDLAVFATDAGWPSNLYAGPGGGSLDLLAHAFPGQGSWLAPFGDGSVTGVDLKTGELVSNVRRWQAESAETLRVADVARRAVATPAAGPSKTFSAILT